MKCVLRKYSDYELLSDTGTLCVQYQIHKTDSKPFDADDERLKDPNCDLAVLESYFDHPDNSDLAEKVVAGGVYRHFKTGKLVNVIGVSQHTEFTNNLTVVYEHDGKLWNRPLEMFLSEVDHEKYPDAKQKMRFELVDGSEDYLNYEDDLTIWGHYIARILNRKRRAENTEDDLK